MIFLDLGEVHHFSFPNKSSSLNWFRDSLIKTHLKPWGICHLYIKTKKKQMSHTIIRVWGNFYILIHKPKVFRQLFKSVSLTFTINSGCQAWDTKKLRIILRLIDLPIPSIKLLSQKKQGFLLLAKTNTLIFPPKPKSCFNFLRVLVSFEASASVFPLVTMEPLGVPAIPPDFRDSRGLQNHSPSSIHSTSSCKIYSTKH